MYQKVLFPTDFSLHSQKIMGCIGEIPGIREVVLLHVVDTISSLKSGVGPGAEIERMKGLIAQDEKSIRNLGLTVLTNVDVMEKTVHEKTIGSRILETAEREKVSMIIMGARGKSLRDMFLGSVSTYVLHHATLPLLLVKSNEADGTQAPVNVPEKQPIFSKVLIPTDFSAPAEELLRFFKGIREVDEIILLYVINAEKHDPRLPEYVSSATTKLNVIRDELVRSGFPVKGYVRVGYPPDEINLLAGQEQVTLIAMSPMGEGWRRELKELFVGSTTYAVVRRTERPVLVVRSIPVA
ncbi:MAG: universal stress protein [Methanomicrobiales archaeon]